MDINTQELKQNAPIIPYIKTFYKDKVIIEKETNGVAFAKCVFHEEDTASLAFYSNGTYKCFGCGEHGDLITFVQKVENLDFQGACILIANNVGYEIKETYYNKDWEDYKDELDNHSRRYWKNLMNNAEALNYIINKRKITAESINNFRLGFTDNDEYKYRKDVSNISNKIVFPILEHKRVNPKCVGMAYRNLTDEKPKYINDKNQLGQQGQRPELNGVFIKGNMLYGLAQAYPYIVKNDFVFIVEGYFDVISMHQAGFKNTVGIMGTSFTEAQIREIKKITRNVFLLLDNDNAGINASHKYIEELIKYDIRPTVCKINGFKDPDELCLHYNFDNNKICKLIESNLDDGIHYIMTNMLDRYKKIVFNERVKTFTKVSSILNTIPNPALRYAYLKELEKELY